MHVCIGPLKSGNTNQKLILSNFANQIETHSGAVYLVTPLIKSSDQDILAQTNEKYHISANRSALAWLQYQFPCIALA